MSLRTKTRYQRAPNDWERWPTNQMDLFEAQVDDLMAQRDAYDTLGYFDDEEECLLDNLFLVEWLVDLTIDLESFSNLVEDAIDFDDVSSTEMSEKVQCARALSVKLSRDIRRWKEFSFLYPPRRMKDIPFTLQWKMIYDHYVKPWEPPQASQARRSSRRRQTRRQ